MSLWRQITGGLRGLFRRDEAFRDAADEVEHFVEQATAEYIAQGMSPAAARRAARLEVGTTTSAIATVRAYGWENIVSAMFADIRFAFRSLRRSPAFTIAAVLTLAIGIGANAAIFSVVNRVLLQPSLFADAERLALVWKTDRNAGTNREPASIPDYRDLRERSRSFERLTAFTSREVNMSAEGADPERVAALTVDAEWFATVGLRPLAGRFFTPDEDRVGGPRRVIISEDLWERRFGRAASAIGSTIRLDENDWEIVGVAARGADFGTVQVLGAAAYMRGFVDRGGRPRVDLWAPLRASPTASRDNHPIFVVGRLAPGATFAAAQEEMARIAADLEREYPQSNRGRGAFVEPFTEVVFGGVRMTMWVLVAAVGLVLLVACVNVANLLLVRAANRARETTVRTALGASPGRLIRQFAAEGMVLVAAGFLLGTGLAFVTVSLLRAMAPATLPRADELRLDGTALLMTAAIAVGIAFVFSLLPTLYARRTNLAAALQSDGRTAAGSRRQRALRSTLVVSELAMATTLTVGAALLIRSLWTLQHVDPGFNASHVLKAEFQLPVSRYPQDFSRFPNWPEQTHFANEIVARLAAMPGIASVALATANPMDAGFTSSIRVVGREAEGNTWPEPSIRTVSDGYFATMEVAVREGRAFGTGDDAAAPPVMLINESARTRYFEGREPLNAQAMLWGRRWTVIGVVGNERIKGLASDAPPAVYLPLAQAPMPSAILVRTTGDANAAAPLVRQVVRDVDPQLALFGMEPLTETIQGTMTQRRFTMLVLVAFASAALILAAVGVHGVLSYTVAQRTREIGIRVALGADLGRIRRLILGEGARLVVGGVAVGIVDAFALSRAMQSLLYGIAHADPLVFALVAVLLTLVAMMACWFPARRAARLDPMDALRAD